MSNTNLISVWEDTKRLCYKKFVADTELSRESQMIYTDGDVFDFSQATVKSSNKSNIVVTDSDTISAALNATGRVAILNFASATTPGGGTIYGSKAQEECICRCTNLLPCLDHNDMLNEYFYDYHRNLNDSRYSNRLIYTPDVIIFKDKDYNVINDYKYIDVITCAAPNLREVPNNCYNQGNSEPITNISDSELYDIHYKRGELIISSAILNNCDYIILGAFGCGVFRNNPMIVALAYKKLMDKYCRYFKHVEFAIYCGNDSTNLQAFKTVFDGGKK